MRSGMMVCSAPPELCHALHANRRSARAFDLRAHLHQQSREVGHFRLAGGVLDHGFAAGQHGRHEQIFRAGDRNAIELHVRALKTAGSNRFDVAVLLPDFRAQSLEPGDVQIDGTRTDRASTGQRNARAPASSDQGA